MKKLLAILSGLFLVAAASCGSDNDNEQTVTTQTFNGLFAVVTSHSSATTAYYDNLNYRLDLNYTSLTANLTISGLKLPDGTSYPTMKLTGLRWNISDNGWKVIKGQMVSPNLTGVATVPVFTNIEIRLYDRVLNTGAGTVYQPGVCFNYVIDSKYTVVSSYTPQLLFGTTESENTGTGTKFTTRGTTYTLKMNTDTRTVSLTMSNARFAEAMHKGLIFNLNNIPVTFVGTKAYFETATIIPTLGTDNTPMEGFPITNLKGEMDFGGDFKLEFDCTPRTAPGTYHVTAECNYAETADEI